MNSLLTVVSLAFAVGVVYLVPGDGATAVLLCAVAAAVAGFFLRRAEGGVFLVQVFVAALLVRLAVAAFIFVFELHEYFGGDALTYDALGASVVDDWRGLLSPEHYAEYVRPHLGNNWGMTYLTALIYVLTGRNMLAVQFFNAVVGAATAPLIYLCAQHIFRNRRVARLSLFFVAFWPSLVLWSAQGLKDGPITFLLAAAFLLTLKLTERLRLDYCALLVATLLCLLSLRFYVFYIVAASIAGSYALRGVAGPKDLLRQYVAIAIVGGALAVLGIARGAGEHLELMGNLENVQRSRAYQTTFNSGYAQELDVSTAGGALSALPIGASYLLFAPFPWQLSSFRAAITLPEMLVWWACFPILIMGLGYAVRHKFREALPILLFTLVLTLAYAIFQGNVGTAYRQRAQLMVFYFIFIAVGYVIFKERRENRKLQRESHRVIRRLK